MVVKKALKQDAIREVIKTRSRFFSIFILVVLAVAFLAGLKTTAPNMKFTADRYFDSSKLMDIHVLSALGMTAKDVAAISTVQGVREAEGGYTVDAYVQLPENDLVVKVNSVSPHALNKPVVIEGRMPKLKNECVVENMLLKKSGKGVCDKITLITGAGSYKDTLRDTEYTIVGVVESPYYISVGRGTSTLGTGVAGAFILLPEAAFDMDCYTDVYLTVDGAADVFCFSKEYDRLVEDVIVRMKFIAVERAALRRKELVDQANHGLNDAKTELTNAEIEAENKLAEARRTLNDAKTELKNARKTLDDGYAELEHARTGFKIFIADAQKKIDEGEAEIADREKKLADGEKKLRVQKAAAEEGFGKAEAELAAAKKQVDSGRLEVEDNKQQLDSLKEQIAALTLRTALGPTAAAQVEAMQAQADQMEQQLGAANAQLAQLQQRINDERETIDAGRRQISEKEEELETGRSRLEQVKAEMKAAQQQLLVQMEQGEDEMAAAKAELLKKAREYKYAKAEIANGEAEYEKETREAELKIADAKQEIREGEQQRDNIPSGKWYLLGRDTNEGYVGYEQDADRMGALVRVFPIIFFIVAALVCLTTMTRMVEEQRIQIGVLKALGYSRTAIAGKYIGYALLASLGGSVIGLIAGCTVIPTTIFEAYSALYSMPDLTIAFHLPISLAALLADVACTTGVTLWACLAALVAAPADLMRPRAPAVGKRVLLERIPMFWKRLSYTQKVTARNLLRYKKRFWMTVMGIAGCMALLITGLGLHDSIFGFMDKQYDEIFRYQVKVSIDANMTEGEINGIEQRLQSSKYAAGSLLCREAAVVCSNGQRSVEGAINVPDDGSRLPEFITLRTRLGHTPVVVPETGALIDEKMSELLGIKIGDTFTIEEDNILATAVVGGIMENYLLHYVYTTPEYYESLFGKPAQNNAIFVSCVDLNDATAEMVAADLISLNGVTSVTRISETRRLYSKSINSINYAIFIVIISAAALAFVVLHNLTNINITERLRELATIKVLGFYDKELSAYIYRENVVFTIIGIVLGLFMGYFLHRWLIRTVEIDMLMFVRSAKAGSYAFAAVLTTLFSGVVNYAAHWKLKKINMVESLKRVE